MTEDDSTDFDPRIVSLSEYPNDITGASSGRVVQCKALAEEVFGEVANDKRTGFSTFAYLYRRFGPPPMDGDGYKDLGAAWVITTPEPDVWVHFYPKAMSISFCFGYLIKNATEEEYGAPESDWHDTVCNALVSRHPEWVMPNEQGDMAFTGHGINEYYRVIFGQDTTDAEKEDLRWAREIAGPFPRKPYGTPWQERGPVGARVNAAIVYTLKELLKPVWSRDVPFNILGHLSEPE